MRDMLERLHAIIEEQEDIKVEFHGREINVDEGKFPQQAVVFEDSSIDDLLQEVHSIRKDISLLELEVERFCMNNERFATSTRRFTLLKKDCDAIARGIQHRGEALYTRLQALDQQSKKLEKEAPNSAVSRIARTQHDMLTLAFHSAMREYNTAEEIQRTTCRGRIQRQASIIGTKITDKKLDELVDKGGEGWTELSQSLQVQTGQTCSWALSEIKGRHKELMELEARMAAVHELFLHMAILVEEQGSMLNSIEAYVCKTKEYVNQGNTHLSKAIRSKRKNPFEQCCPCLSFLKR